MRVAVSFTPARQMVFLGSIAEGQTVRGASARAGISRDAVYYHMREDPSFLQQVERARGEAESKLVDSITKSSHTGDTITTPGGKVVVRPGDWKAAAWLLEHHPETRERYAAIAKTQVSGDPDNPTPILVGLPELRTDQLEAIALILADAGALPAPRKLLESEVTVRPVEKEE